MHYAIIILCVFIAGYAFNSFLNKDKRLPPANIPTTQPVIDTPKVVPFKLYNRASLFKEEDKVILIALVHHAIYCDCTIKPVNELEHLFFLAVTDAYDVSVSELLFYSMRLTDQSLIQRLSYDKEILKHSLFEINYIMRIDGVLNEKENEFIDKILSAINMPRDFYLEVISEYDQISNEIKQ